MNEIRLELELPATPEQCFRAFQEKFADWYPPEYSWSAGTLKWIGIEGHEGGVCYELGPNGFRLDWGRVLVFEPPVRLSFTWQIGFDRVPTPDPGRSTVIHLEWRPLAEDRTAFTFRHTDFTRVENGEAYRQAMASPQGWPYILERYREFVASGL